MSKEVDEASATAYAKGFSAGADSIAGVGHARSASNTESQVGARTTKDADRSETSTASFSRRDSDIGIEEAWSQFALEAARRDRVHFDNEQTDARRHSNESAERTAVVHNETIKYNSSLSAQVLDAQKLGTNNMWTASNELEQVVLAMVTKIIAENASRAE